MSITLKNGGLVEGSLVREDATEVVVRTGNGSIGVARQYIASLKKSVRHDPIPPAATRVPSLMGWVRTVAQRPYGRELKQVPAAVVTSGPVRHVPYVSHTAAEYEFNVYGDPDHPACVEVGVPRARGRASRIEARTLLALGLSDQGDSRLVESLPVDEDSARGRGGLVFEVTQPDAPDAHAHWWICVYSTGALEAARIPDVQLSDFVVHERDVGRGHQDEHSWSLADMERVRPRGTAGRTVFVRGYTRRDGVYVSPHVRSSPRSASGGGRRGGGRR